MNHCSLIKFTFARCTPAALLGGLSLFMATTSQASVLYSCPGGAGGDWNTEGFYMPSYPGITLDSATLKLLGSVAGTYQVSLTVRSGAYDGPVLGTSTVTVGLNASSGAMVSTTFPFPSVTMPKGGLVCFILSVVSGPYGMVYYDVGGGCTEVIETEDTSPPLSSFRRDGVDLTLTGALGTIAPGWSIQAAINAAVPGETVFVGPGTFHEDLYLRSGISVVGSGFDSTFLQGTGDVRVVNSISVTNSRFAGFQITGCGNSFVSAGVWINGGNLMLDDNWILGNTNGVWINPGSSPIVRNNLIDRNGNPRGGSAYAGIVYQNSTPLITGNVILNGPDEGIRGETWSGPVTGAQIINNTIVGNPAYSTFGIEGWYGAMPTIKNNIIATNAIGINGTTPAGPLSSFNDLWANRVANYSGTAVPGPGDLALDPLFDPASPSLFALAIGSPCIHAGDPGPIYNNPDGTRNTMGAYGGPSALTPGVLTSLTSGFLFSSIGSIPASSISTTVPRAGLATVDSATASALQIPQWEDAPFGGQVQLHGLFGSSDTSVHYYQILGAKWNGDTPPGPSDFVPILDPLSKIKYTIGSGGVVVASLVNVGPDANGLYMRTDLPDSGYWTSPNLKLLLNTVALQNSRYDFICRAYASDNLSSQVTLPGNSLSNVTLWIDNNGVVVNLTNVLDVSGNIISECGIIPLATGGQNLQFQFTAYHPSGFLYSYSLGSYYGRNRYGGYIAADQYAGTHDSPGPFWSGVGPGTSISNSLPAQVAGTLAGWQTCAYQFQLSAWARTTDGVNRIYWNTFNDHYYINVGPALPGGCLGDLNGDGRVNGADLVIFAQRFGTNCAPTGP